MVANRFVKEVNVTLDTHYHINMAMVTITYMTKSLRVGIVLVPYSFRDAQVAYLLIFFFEIKLYVGKVLNNC